MKYAASIVFGLLLIPNFVSAATLSQSQVSAIIEVLTAFGVDSATIASVRADLSPVATSSPVVIGASSTPPSASVQQTTNFSPIQTTTPTFGGISIVQTPAAPIVCDDTPVITQNIVHLADSFTFNVVATSTCDSKWLIDWNASDYGATGHDANGNWVYGNRTLDGFRKNVPSGAFLPWSIPSQPGTYTQTFVAHDGKTTGTSTVDFVVN